MIARAKRFVELNSKKEKITQVEKEFLESMTDLNPEGLEGKTNESNYEDKGNTCDPCDGCGADACASCNACALS